jgi:peptide chain release factor 1
MSKNLILDKLEGVKSRFEEVARLINEPETIADMNRSSRLMKNIKIY